MEGVKDSEGFVGRWSAYTLLLVGSTGQSGHRGQFREVLTTDSPSGPRGSPAGWLLHPQLLTLRLL